MSSASATLALLAINATDDDARDAYLQASRFALLNEEIRACTLCPLHARSTQRVPPILKSSNAILIGEAPGADEDKRGIPFVGRAGAKLDSILDSVGLARDEFTIANTICCRPPDNSYDYAEAMGAPDRCRPYLDRTLELSDAWIVIAVGARALTQVLGPGHKRVQIKDRRGQWWWHEGRLYTCVYHPSFLLRQSGFDVVTRDDFARIADIMHARYELPAPPLTEFKPLIANVTDADMGNVVKLSSKKGASTTTPAELFKSRGWLLVHSAILDAQVLVVRSHQDPKIKIPKELDEYPRYALSELATLKGSRELLRRVHLAKTLIKGELWL